VREFATRGEIKQLCDEARDFGFRSVVVTPGWVSYAQAQLADTDVLVCGVINFPNGTVQGLQHDFDWTRYVDNLDVVFPLDCVVRGAWGEALTLLKELRRGTKGELKVIIETNLLKTNAQVRRAVKAVRQCGADYVKTNTGRINRRFRRGELVDDVRLIKQHLFLSRLKLKASGGIKTYGDLVKLTRAGAHIVGTSSGAHIMRQAERELQRKK
jgi:deoxyribose-phosphate aldolase